MHVEYYFAEVTVYCVVLQLLCLYARDSGKKTYLFCVSTCIQVCRQKVPQCSSVSQSNGELASSHLSSLQLCNNSGQIQRCLH